MVHNIIDIKCPGCGGPARTDDKNCKYCGRQVVISTFKSVYDMNLDQLNQYTSSYKSELLKNPDNVDVNISIGMCYLKLKLYQNAYKSFEKAIENDFDNSEIYFYAAISLLNGKKAFLAQKRTIQKIVDLTNSAITIENKGIYYYFLAYIKYDFYERKSLNILPNYIDELYNASNNGVTYSDREILFNLLGVSMPNAISI